MDNFARRLIAALESADLEPRDYSGRGMYGRRCVGVVVERDFSLVRLGAILGAEMGDEAFDLSERTDSMGLDMIVYWPGVAWPEEEDEDDVQSDEE